MKVQLNDEQRNVLMCVIQEWLAARVEVVVEMEESLHAGHLLTRAERDVCAMMEVRDMVKGECG